MISRISTIAFQGIKGIPVEVQVMVSPGRVGVQIVGLPDKAVIESRERIQSHFIHAGLLFLVNELPSIYLQLIYQKKDLIMIYLSFLH
ncbi:magnesium chelatase [Candidatus Liberibacter asiaticus]|uniref:Mg2+ chelatase family protein n=2 Tax=Liberibacter asiaticus TaxID=34021 RepID=A0ABM5NGV7_LIBAS|nr:putative Mg2+ chelatase family protein [Candidatus Liberibacter asiaticus str. psy62]AGH17265.1 putative Mg2+ chelatase family protein [Candidatus Liberibacter asiaticus str. gxpsy]KAE9509788.1 putative ATP-dependent protease [Candidatus Liberibacter asiaticus]BAP26797.1 putative Mg2+ chelatase family protein [Candidatus Liberibacter asiaticus str. Ishi-1]KAE9511406.1 putative ATP-dependent protease [Candidatus Liberibacter asiaticus]